MRERERARRAKNKHLSEGDRRHQKRALLPYSEFINSREPNVPQLISRCPMSEPLSTYVSCGSLGACRERNPRPHLVVNTTHILEQRTLRQDIIKVSIV